MFNRVCSLLWILLFVWNIQQHDTLHDSKSEDSKGLLGFLFFEDECACKCGRPNRDARLLGGEYLTSYEFPWLALIQIRGEITVPGTLINDRYVITSTSQMVGLTPYDLKITLGQFDRCFPDVSSQNVSVSAIILHPDFSPGNRAHDLALIKLSAPVLFQKNIQSICLASVGATYLGQVASVVGWSEGPMPPTGDVTSSCRPRKLGLPILGYTECLGTAFDSQYVSLDKGCIGIVGTPSVICSTDAGGPVMYRSYGGIYELIGVLTDKNDCSAVPSTALYTKINDNLNWLKQNTYDACYCFKF